jgi:hypothetical protein
MLLLADLEIFLEFGSGFGVATGQFWRGSYRVFLFHFLFCITRLTDKAAGF